MMTPSVKRITPSQKGKNAGPMRAGIPIEYPGIRTLPPIFTPYAMIANSAPSVANMTPPQNSFGCPIFICDPFQWPVRKWRSIMALLHEPEELGGGDVRLLPLLDESGHLLVGDVDDLDPLLGHLAAEIRVLVDLDEHVRDALAQ